MHGNILLYDFHSSVRIRGLVFSLVWQYISGFEAGGRLHQLEADTVTQWPMGGRASRAVLPWLETGVSVLSGRSHSLSSPRSPVECTPGLYSAARITNINNTQEASVLFWHKKKILEIQWNFVGVKIHVQWGYIPNFRSLGDREHSRPVRDWFWKISLVKVLGFWLFFKDCAFTAI